MKGTIIIVCLLMSLVINLGLAFRVLDLGAVITDGSDEIIRRGKQVHAMQELFPAILKDGSRVNFATAAEKLGLQVLDKNDEGVYVEGIQFIFSEGQVSAVDFN
jgi:hypothetical protein